MIELIFYCVVSIGGATLPTPTCLSAGDFMQALATYSDTELSLFIIKQPVPAKSLL